MTSRLGGLAVTDLGALIMEALAITSGRTMPQRLERLHHRRRRWLGIQPFGAGFVGAHARIPEKYRAGCEVNSRQRDYLLICISVFGGWCLAALLPWKLVVGQTSKDWVDATAALGAVLAVLVSIALYAIQKLNKDREDRAIGALVFFRVREHLNNVLSIAAQIESACADVAKIRPLNWLAGKHAPVRIRDLCIDAQNEVRADDLERLLKLGGRPVHKYTQGLEMLRVLHSEIVPLAEPGVFFGLPADEQVQFYLKWAKWAKTSRKLIHAAIDEFAELSAPDAEAAR